MSNSSSASAVVAPPAMVPCQGCAKPTMQDFQCPLCQAEAVADRGYFCTQECFAQHWLEHRKAFHKSGVVREKKRTTTSAVPVETKEKNRATRSKRPRDAEAEDGKAAAGTASTTAAAQNSFEPWPPLPDASTCQREGCAQTMPPLPLDIPRAVVRPVAAAAAKTSPVRRAEAPLPHEYMWSALLAAAQYAAASVSPQKSPASSSPGAIVASDAPKRVLVVAGSVYTAHAFAWAARCVGLSGRLRLLISETVAEGGESVAASPSQHFTSARPIVVATAAVVRAAALVHTTAATAVSGAASLWLTGAPADAVLVTLPDVVDAEDLQGVQTRAVFFAGPAATAEEKEEDGVLFEYTAADVLSESGQPLRWSPVALLAPGTSSEEDPATVVSGAVPEQQAMDRIAAAAASRLDNDLSTCFANGDLAGALQQLVRLYQHRPGHLEATLFYTLCCNWGAAHLVHAHHRLAYVARILCDHSHRFVAPKNATLADVTLRAIAAVCRLLPRMADVEAERAASTGTTAELYTPSLASTTRPVVSLVKDANPPSAQELDRYATYYTHLPNLQLQATVCHLYPAAPPAVLDTMALAWGLYRYLPGPRCLEDLDRARHAAVLRVRQRITAKLDAAHGSFYVVLMHLLYDAVGPYSLPLEEVHRRLQWNLTLSHDVGSLESYLRSCGLLVGDDGLLLPTASGQKVRKAAVVGNGTGGNVASGAALSSRLRGTRASTQSRIQQLRCFAVKAVPPTAGTGRDGNYGFTELPWKRFPITGERQREVARLHEAAVEEVLMAMPRVPRPMYVGDVGNLIGKWMHFNARFDGALGATLLTFLEQHPESFKVLDNIVTRRTAGTTEQIRIRFDGEDSGGDDDEDDRANGRLRKTRDGLRTSKGKGAKAAVELPARARKRQERKAFNKERFNRNYRSIDPSARVPGYIKHGDRRIKGRGKKANKRVVKRGT